MKYGIVVAVMAMALCFPAFAEAERAPSADVEKVVAGNTAFALDLYRRLAAEQGNLILSPHSISAALAMTSAGARGRTAEQMAKTLHFDLPQAALHPAFGALIDGTAPAREGAFALHVANALWGQRGEKWLPAFLKTTQGNYGAGLREVDFVRARERARVTINQWVEKQTRDKIKDLLQRGVLTPDTRLVLTNAIYFKGEWSHPFEKRATRPRPFTLADGTKVKTPMMSQVESLSYAEEEGLQAIEKQYAGGEVSMVVLLPRKVDGLPALEKQLDAATVNRLVKAMRLRQVRVLLPKVEMTSSFELNKALTAMGMPDAFDARRADFSGMNGRRDLFISKVIHQAFVAVDEKGTEAAAATAVVMEGKAAFGDAPVPFHADHPFLFLLRHRFTGTILFIGRVLDPRP